jgi:replicative DNA helicase
MSDQPKRRSRAKTDATEAPSVKIPHDPFNEQVLIASMLVSTEAAEHLLARVKPMQFVGDGHAALVDAIVQARRQGLALDAAALRQIAGDAVNPRYVEQLIKQHPKAPPNLAHHVAMLGWDTARARAVEGPIASLLGALTDPTADPERVRALARQVPQAFEGYGQRQYMFDSEQLIAEAMADISNRRNGQSHYPYGIPGLDDRPDGKPRMTPGSKCGEITLVTAVSGSGKSTVLARMALGLARQKRKVLFGAWEMKAPLTLELVATFSLGWSRYMLSTGQLSNAQLVSLEQRMRQIAQYIKFWKFPWGRDMGKRPRSNEEVLDRIQGYISDSGCEVCIFDLLRRAFVDRRVEAEEAALEAMQVMADETQTHHIYAHQQRLKDIEQRKDKHPTREGVKGTSVWVDVPDTIIGIHLPSLWGKVPRKTLELIVLKQRNGPWPMAIEYDWDPDYAALTDPRDIEYTMSGADDDSGLGAWMNRSAGGGAGGH